MRYTLKPLTTCHGTAIDTKGMIIATLLALDATCPDAHILAWTRHNGSLVAIMPVTVTIVDGCHGSGKRRDTHKQPKQRHVF